MANQLKLTYGDILTLVKMVDDYDNFETIEELNDYLSHNEEVVITVALMEDDE